MKYDFDKVTDRRNTACYKWDQSEKLFGDKDVLPMWVADMDFQAPPEVVEAIVRRAEHGIYGYTVRPQSYYDAIIGWQRRRHGWELEQDWISSSPGVVSALSLMVEIMTEPGDKVILQAPVYYPFYDVIKMNGRTVANNPLRLEDRRYTMDFDQLEQMLDSRTKLLLLCNPHNPGGRVWTREELERLGEICLKHGIFVVSDEIHEDLVFKGRRHIPFASISEAFAQNSATCTAPSKTFNLAGLQTSNVIIPNPQIRRAYNHRLKALSIHMEGYFGETAVESCYTHGDEWLDQLMAYLQDNLDYLLDYFQRHLPQVKVMPPEGTYLVWVDCRGLSTDVQALKELMYNKAGVAFNEGSSFGKEGEGFLRINIACPRSLLKEGLRRFVSAAQG